MIRLTPGPGTYGVTAGKTNLLAPPFVITPPVLPVRVRLVPRPGTLTSGAGRFNLAAPPFAVGDGNAARFFPGAAVLMGA